MIDAIDTDTHARPGDAELTPWLMVLDCAPQHVAAEFRSIMRDTRPQIKLTVRPAELHGVHTAAGPSVHASLQEFDPQRGGRALRRVLLGSRVQLRTCQIELLAGASSIGKRWSIERFSQKQKRLLETGRTVSTRHSRGA